MSATLGLESVGALKVVHKSWRAKWTGNIQLTPG
jgi:hypothetical protein